MKLLIVGNGPSKKNIDLIKNFDGEIMAVDSVTAELIEKGVMPDYVSWLEVASIPTGNIVMNVIPKLKGSILVHRRETCVRVIDECAKYGIRMKGFGPPAYVNNVGLFSIVFAQQSLHCKEIHLIGLDYGGTKIHNPVYGDMIGSFETYMAGEQDEECKMTDHSGGALRIHKREWYSAGH